MIQDFRECEDGMQVEADLCLIGAGAAGIAIAREFLGSKFKICLVESGGLDLDPAAQKLNETEDTGLYRRPHAETRQRIFGGTTNHWTGLCGLMSDHDFDPHPWIPDSGWPIKKAELDPYYEEALQVCQDRQRVFDSRIWGLLNKSAPPLSGKRLQEFFVHYSPSVRFGQTYRQEISEAKNIQALLHANVSSLETNQRGTYIEGVRLRALSGKTGSIRARAYVLCAGGIDNPRLMLLSNRVEPYGIGNRFDLVGRFFMDHPRAKVGEVIQSGHVPLHDLYCDFESKLGRLRPGLSLSYTLQSHEQVLNCGLYLWRNKDTDSRGTRALKALPKRLTEGDLTTSEFSRDLDLVVADLDHIAYDVRRRLTGAERAHLTRPRLDVMCILEQAPIPSSRVMLSEQLDALGLRRAKVEWRLTDLEKRTIAVGMKALALEFGRLNLGRVHLEDWLTSENPDWAQNLEDYNHHMGTTRMADDPKKGVVNRDCQVHGIDNLFIAGSSVFPTSGYINPTVTLLALALRLAARLKSILR